MTNQSPHFGDTEKSDLQRSEARFRAAVEAVQGILWTNDANGEMRGQQPGWTALTGQTAEHYEGHGWSTAIHPDDADATVKAWDKAVVEKRTFVFEHRLRRHDGEYRRYSIRAVPIIDSGGSIIEWVGVHTDVTEQREAVRLLRESEYRFRNMADNAPVMMWVTNADGYCTYLNARWHEFTGQTAEEAEGFGWLDATHPDDKSEAERKFLEANALQEAFRIDYRLRRSDGVYRWVLDAASPRFDNDGTFLGYVGSVIDIDEKRETEDRLRDLNASLAQRVDETLAERRVLADIVEGTDAFVQVVDLEFNWLAINAAASDEFYRIYGVRPYAGDNMLKLLAGMPDDLAAVKAVWTRALAGEEFVETGEFGSQDRERRIYEMKYNVLRDANGVQIGAYQFVYDVTSRVMEQRQLAAAEQARRDTDALYRTYFENSAEALFVVKVESDDNFIVEEINPAHAKGVGFDAEKMRGKRLEEFLPEETALRVIASYREVLRTGEAYHDTDVFELNGSRKHWDTSILPIRDENGNIVRLVGSRRDVTRRVLAEEALKQSQKMEAMGQLTGGVAHDFNNLLTPIVGALDMLTRRAVGSERDQQLIAGAAQSAERAKILVQRLLAFARKQPLQAVAVDLAELVANMGDLIDRTTGPQVKVIVEIANEVPPAIADANQLEMALLNLAVNARDAMPDGGMLRIALSSESIGGENIHGLKPGNYVRLAVGDTGIGMDESTLRQAIEPFFSTKGVGQGTGLGLSMVHGLAAQLGGSLDIFSQKGLGTKVSLLLPAGENAGESESICETSRISAKYHGTVLLVDDEALVRMMVADMLTELGFKVVEAHSAEHALKLVEEGIEPNLLMTDHLMPGMTGPELVQQLRRDRPDLKALLVSGYADSAGVAPDLPRLTKPFLTNELVNVLADLF